MKREHGIECREMSGDEARTLEPALAPSIATGVFTPAWSHVTDPKRIWLGLLDAVRALGVSIEQQEVRGFGGGGEPQLTSDLAPFDVIVTPASIGDASQRSAAETIYRECLASGHDALLDDRDERPGVKFKDADLLGVPFRVTVGKKIAEGLVAIVERKTKEVTIAEAGRAAASVKAYLPLKNLTLPGK